MVDNASVLFDLNRIGTQLKKTTRGSKKSTTFLDRLVAKNGKKKKKKPFCPPPLLVHSFLEMFVKDLARNLTWLKM